MGRAVIVLAFMVLAIGVEDMNPEPAMLHGFCAVCGAPVRPLPLSVVVRRYNPDLEYVTVQVTLEARPRILCEKCLFVNLQRLFGIWRTEMRTKDRDLGEQMDAMGVS